MKDLPLAMYSRTAGSGSNAMTVAPNTVGRKSFRIEVHALQARRTSADVLLRISFQSEK